MATLMMMIAGAPPTTSQSFNSHLSFSRSENLGSPLSLSTSISLSSASSPPSLPLVKGLSVYCGRGDRKTAKGKRFSHSYGNARPRDKNKGRGPPRVVAPPLPRKDKLEDIEKIEVDIDESLFDS